MSFRTRVTVVSAAAVAVAVALASSGIYVAARTVLRDQVDDALRERADLAQLRAGPAGLALAFPRRDFGLAPTFEQLVTPDGHVVNAEDRFAIPVGPPVRAVAQGTRDEYLADDHVDGIHVRVLTRRIGPGIAIQVARPLAEVDATLQRLAFVLVLFALSGIALAAMLGRLVAHTALAPVRRMSEATRHVATTQDLSRRLDVSGRDELGELASDFNTMLDALDRSVTAQRQLVADASHELRTPLTSLRTNVELLARGAQVPAAERTRMLGDAVAQIEELSSLVGDVVELARGNRIDEEQEELRLDDLVADEVERMQRHAPDAVFATELEPTAVTGARSRVARAVANLLDNAVKWSPPGAVIEVRVREGAVVVRDRGPGIAEADLPHVFDRFYRAPSARGLPGSGLGLAIVREVAEGHGGRVSAARAEGGGAELRLELGPPKS